MRLVDPGWSRDRPLGREVFDEPGDQPSALEIVRFTPTVDELEDQSQPDTG